MTTWRAGHHRARAGWALAALILLAAGAVSAQAPPEEDVLRPVVIGCPVCDLWLRHQDLVLQANQEVGSLENGVIYYVHAENPSVIEPLIRFAYQRAELETEILRDPELRAELGEACGHHFLGDGTVRLEISTGAHGFFAILTSDDEEIVSLLKEEASQAVRGRIVRF